MGTRAIEESDIEEQVIEDEADDHIINEAVEQEAMEQRVQRDWRANDEEMLAAYELTHAMHMNKATKKLTERANKEVDEKADEGEDEEADEDTDKEADEEASEKSMEEASEETDEETNKEADELTTEEAEEITEEPQGKEILEVPVTPEPKESLFVDLNLLSPRFDRLQLESDHPLAPQELLSHDLASTTLRQQVQVNQKHANKLSQQKYGKQRQTTTYEIGDQISVPVSTLDRASTDNKQIFRKVIDVKADHGSYQILTKYGVLDRCYPISQLNPLPGHIDLGISDPPPTKVVTLHYCAAQESTTEKVLVHCNCRDQKTSCSTRRCACVKAEAKCSIACHGGTNQDNTPDCPNISSMTMRTQRGHRVRNRDQENKDAKRQRRNTGGRWVATKGNELIDNSENNISKGDSKGDSKGGSKGGSKEGSKGGSKRPRR